MLPQSSIYRSASVLLSLCVAGALQSTSQTTSAVKQPIALSGLRDGFRNPPPAARLRCYWWWLNGNTDAATITHDLEEMKAKGFGGALLVDANGANQEGNASVPAGPTFGSKEWVALYLHALREADRLGLEITLNITSGWNLGGPGVKPEEASKVLTWTRTPIQGGTANQITLPKPESKNGFYREIAVLAYPLAHGQALAPQPGSRTSPTGGDSTAVEKRSASTLKARSAASEASFSMGDASEMLNDQVSGSPTNFADTSVAGVQNITRQVAADGSLSWHPPAGDWEILRIGYTDSDARVSTGSGAWQGLAIDYLSRASFESYWQRTVEPLVVAAKPFHSLKYLATDSWELGGANWTDNFGQEFFDRRGYDPVPWLPVLAGRIVGDRNQSTRFLTDLRRTVADLIASEHYGVFAEKAKAYGLGVQAESGGPHGAPIDALETFRTAAVPQTEFWSQNPHRETDKDRFFVKEAASAAHIYGQRLVAAEGETSIGPQWSESLATDLKPSFDMAITEGMNRLVWHEFTSSPASTGLPGQEYFAGTHLNPKVTWWNAGVPFFTYLNRAQFLMQQGLPVADLLYFYGDNVPNFVRLKSDDPAHVLPGYDYDVTDQDALLHTLQIEGGRLRGPGGMEWKALMLPSTGRVSLEVLKRVEQYVAQGGTAIGLAPQSTTGQQTPAAQAEFQSLVRRLWGQCLEGSHHLFGMGQVFCTTNAHSALAAMHVPQDLSIDSKEEGSKEQGDLGTSSTAPLDYIHQRVGKTDAYFLRNGSDQVSHHLVVFRVKDEVPEIWNLLTGEMSTASGARSLPDGRVEVPIDLPPFGSSLVVFAPGLGHRDQASLLLKRSMIVETAKPWEITFQADRGAPAGAVQTAELKSWTEWSEPGVRYFSGTATYHADVMAPQFQPGDHVWLRLSDVREIAQVTINGKDAGTVWAKPPMLRVDAFLKPGSNRLEIAVTNLWPNRMIGDLQPGAQKHFTSSNITKYKADSPLLPSGLIGPIGWVIER